MVLLLEERTVRAGNSFPRQPIQKSPTNAIALVIVYLIWLLI
jgi:hypothetical protein